MALAGLAIDIGGTFTDVAVCDTSGMVHTVKVSTRADAAPEAVMAALTRIQPDFSVEDFEHVFHATTVGTNALLEHQLPRVGFIVTKGFRHVLQLRRGKRGDLYNLAWDPPLPLVPQELTFEVNERIGADGAVATALTDDEVERVVGHVRDAGVVAVAICLLNAPIESGHELRLADALRAEAPSLHVALSHMVDADLGEYERASTTVIHAALKPVISAYVTDLQAALASGQVGGARLLIMQSNGGLATADQIVQAPGLAIESGPAAGAVYAAALSRDAGVRRAISFDVGGTTAKTCLIEDGEPGEVGELRVGGEFHAGEGFSDPGGYLVRGRAVDLVEVGSGGGSLCAVDAQGVLHVGPSSAGAYPGPVAYGRGGTVPTVTDALLVLGYLEEGEHGDVALNVTAARAAIQVAVADPLSVSVEDAAWLIYRIANSNMIRGIGAVSSERGRDPAQYTLMAFGGAGPSHAVEVAAQLGMAEVVIPDGADSLSAIGLHACGVRRDLYATTAELLSNADGHDLEQRFADLEDELEAMFARDGLGKPELVRFLDIRFVGQGSSMSVPVRDHDHPRMLQPIAAAFREMYKREYGHVAQGGVLEIAAARVRAVSRFEHAPRAVAIRATPAPAASTEAYFGPGKGLLQTRVLDRHAVAATGVVRGPALIRTGQATVVVPPGATARAGETSIVVSVHGRRRSDSEDGGGGYARPSLQLFRNQLAAVLDRMAYTLARTAHSPVVSQGHDFSVGLADGAGTVVDQGVGILMHLGSVAGALQALRDHELHPLSPGDVVLLNDPYSGGQHLPDFIVIVPVFTRGELVGHTVAVAHMTDIGSARGSAWAPGATELLQEGLIIPPVKLYDQGRVNSGITDIIRRNVRFPNDLAGDLDALIGAARIGAATLSELVEGVGSARVKALMSELIAYTRDRARTELWALGRAEGRFEDFLDGDGVTSEPVKICAHVSFDGRRASLDLTGSSPQRRSGINATLLTTRSMFEYCVRTQLSRDFPSNAGLDDFLVVHAEAGSVVSATDDAPVASRALTAYRVVDAVFGAMARALPGKVCAAGDGSRDPLVITGRRADGSRFTMADSMGGVMGARPTKDGLSGVNPAVANGRDQSAEVLEATFPIRITHYGIAETTGGGGQYRGGDALTRGYEILCDQAEAHVRGERDVHRPWGLSGGGDGAPSVHRVERSDGRVEALPAKCTVALERGDRLYRQSAAGGGYGDTRLRARRKR